MAIKVNGNTVIDNTEAASVTNIHVTSTLPEVKLIESDRTVGVDQISRFVAASGITYLQAESGDIRFSGYNNVTLPQPPKLYINSFWESVLHSNSNITIGSTNTLDVSAGTLMLADNQVAANKVAAATTTARGSVEKATAAEAKSGTAADKYPDVVGVKAARDNDRFTSTAQTITAAGSLTIAHGLSAAPTVVTAWIKCLVADGGYSVGDEVFVVVQGATNSSTTNNKGVSIVRDATNLTIRFGSSPNTFQPLHKTTGVAYNSFVNTSWEIYFHAML